MMVELFQLFVQSLLSQYGWTMRMKLLCSIVLLIMKAQEKSRHCPFLKSNSASSAFNSDMWQEVSDSSSEQTGRFWREHRLCFWQGEDPKDYGYWCLILGILSRNSTAFTVSRSGSEITTLWVLFLHLSGLHYVILLKNLILMK